MGEEPSTPTTDCLLRLPEVFADWGDEILRRLGATTVKRLGKEWCWVRLVDGAAIRESPMAKYIAWSLPVQHSWPCQPAKTEGFIEKAAQALRRKFGGVDLQTIQVGAFDPGGDRYYKTLASNLRGRALQLFDASLASIRHAGEQDPQRLTLYVMVGREGLLAGVCSPAQAGAFHPGGTRFIRQQSEAVVSRAGAKIAEALHQLPLHAEVPPAGAHWLELGASPGGMTAELLDRGYRVTALDRAPLDARVAGRPGLVFLQADVADFHPPGGMGFDAILSDMNGDAVRAMGEVARLAAHLHSGGLVLFTLKLAGCGDLEAVEELSSHVRQRAEAAGLELRACRHLTYNRLEFTCLFRRR